MKARASGPSTDRRGAAGRLAPHAWPLAQIDEATRRAAAARWNVGVSHLAATLDSPTSITKVLETLPAQYLAVLEVLAEAGGRAPMHALVTEAERRCRLKGDAVQWVLDDLQSRCLAVVLVTNTPYARLGTELAALVTPSAEHVAKRVRGVSLPSGAPGPEASTTRDPAQLAPRDAIALVALTAHRKLRFNLSLTVNRSGLRPFIKGLGVAEDAAERPLQLAMERNVLGGSGDRLVPLADRLVDLAREGGFGSPDRRVAAWLSTRGWTSTEALARALTLPSLGRESTRFSAPSDASGAVANTSATLAKLGGLDHAEVDGVHWVRRPPVGDWTGDGHVTPSFDILLGPGAGLELTAVLALGAELTHVDRLLTLRIGPASVAAGIARGLDPARFVDALEHVAPRPLPDNVRAMVADWTARARVARTRVVTMLELPADAADAVAGGALAAHVVGRAAPGVLLLRQSVSPSQLEAELHRHGVSLTATLTLERAIQEKERARYGYGPSHADRFDDDDDDDDDEWSADAPMTRGAPEVDAPGLPLEFEGESALRERFVAERARGFAATKRAEPAAMTRPEVPEPEHDAWSERLSRGASGARAAGATDLARALELVRAAWVESAPALARWIGALPRVEQERARAELTPSTTLPWLTIVAKYQRRILERARSRIEFAARTEESMHRLSPRGAELVGLIRVVGLERLLAAIDAPSAPVAAMPAPSAAPQLQPPASEGGRAPVASTASELAAFFAGTPSGASVRLTLKGADGATRSYDVAYNGMQRRGADAALLTVELASDEGRVIALRDVIGAERLDA